VVIELVGAMTPSFSSTGRIRKDPKGQKTLIIISSSRASRVKKNSSWQYSDKGLEQETKLLVLAHPILQSVSCLFPVPASTTTPLLLGVGYEFFRRRKQKSKLMSIEKRKNRNFERTQRWTAGTQWRRSWEKIRG